MLAINVAELWQHSFAMQSPHMIKGLIRSRISSGMLVVMGFWLIGGCSERIENVLSSDDTSEGKRH